MNNPLNMIMNLMQAGKNPQALIQNIVKQNNNPILTNAFNLMQQGKPKDVEQIARNICQARGMDYDKEFTNFKNMFNKK